MKSNTNMVTLASQPSDYMLAANTSREFLRIEASAIGAVIVHNGTTVNGPTICHLDAYEVWEPHCAPTNDLFIEVNAGVVYITHG